MTPKNSITKLLRSYAAPFWKSIVLIIFVTLFANVVTTVQPLIVAGMIDVIVGKSLESSRSIADVHEVNSEENVDLFNLNHIGSAVSGAFIRGIDKEKDGNVISILLVLASAYVGLVLVGSLVNYLGAILVRWVRARTTALIRRNLMSHLLSLSLGYFHESRTGDLRVRGR